MAYGSWRHRDLVEAADRLAAQVKILRQVARELGTNSDVVLRVDGKVEVPAAVEAIERFGDRIDVEFRKLRRPNNGLGA